MTKKNQIKCKCGREAKFFHSKCCMAHFEGVIGKNGELSIICEKCGKFVAYVFGKSTGTKFGKPNK